MDARHTQLEDIIRPAVEALGFELWGTQYNTGGKRVLLRIFIDSENGISVDDCAAVSRQVSAVMDVEDPITAEYVLEVSSPGVDRPLYTLDQYKRYTGYTVKIQLRIAFEGQKRFTGVLNGVEEDEIILHMGEEEMLFPFDSIDKASLIGEVDANSGKN